MFYIWDNGLLQAVTQAGIHQGYSLENISLDENYYFGLEVSSELLCEGRRREITNFLKIQTSQ